MTLGPVEVLAIKFPGNEFKGEIIPALAEAVEKDIIRIIDIVLIHKGAGGDVRVIEMIDLPEKDRQVFNPIVAEVTGMISEEDIGELSSLLDNNSSAGFLAFEHKWAVRLRDAIVGAKGELVFSERIPADVVAEAEAAVAAKTA